MSHIKTICVQHLVRLRWEELSPTEHKNFANLSVDLMYEIADPCENWALKSQTSALVAEVFTMMLFIFIYIASYPLTIAVLLCIKYIWFVVVVLSQIVRREGLNLWQEMLPSLVSLSSKGPIQVNFMFPLCHFLHSVYSIPVYVLTLFFNDSQLHQAELVSMMLRWLPEDITVHNEDLEGL